MVDNIQVNITMTKPINTPTIFFIGSKNYYHEALSYAMEHEIGVKCEVVVCCDTIPQEFKNGEGKKGLVLINYLEKEFEKELAVLGFQEKGHHDSIVVALFNLQKGTGIERRAFNKGVKGFFYRDDSLPHMRKGLQALLTGEIWISRDILVEVALKSSMPKTMATRKKMELTEREMEILALVSTGSSNEEIAEKLFISPHTVKTHLYKVFQKIKVPNRLQAALWAAKNL
jgi:DNA-binding NarL/FixJ family response regulator